MRWRGRRRVAPAALVGTPWLLGPSGSDPSTETGAFLARQAIAPQRSRTFPNIAAALAQVAAGRGVTLAVAHTVRDELERGALVVLDVRGTPIPGLWHVSVLGPERRTAPGGRAAALRHAARGDARDPLASQRGPGRALPAGRSTRAGSGDTRRER